MYAASPKTGRIHLLSTGYQSTYFVRVRSSSQVLKSQRVNINQLADHGESEIPPPEPILCNIHIQVWAGKPRQRLRPQD